MARSRVAIDACLAAAAALCLCLAGCEERQSDRLPPPPDAEEIDRLRSLPYVGFSPGTADRAQSGVVLLDEERSWPGYNLYSNHKLCSAYLVDARGETVRSWARPGRHWANCELLPDGDLLVVGTDPAHDGGDEPDDAHRFLMRFSWDGELLWKREITAHHDVALTPDGRLLTLGVRLRREPALHPTIDVRDNPLLLLDAGGRPIAERSMFDLFAAAPEIVSFQPVRPRLRRGQPQIVLFHANSVEWMHRPELAARDPLYAMGNVLFCSRHQDTIAVVNWESGELVWAWGQGILSGPHDATVLENGNFLLFDNGINRGWSRVLELDPLSRRIVWEYRAPDPTAFYTLTRGSSQRLPNGNTLIADSEAGRAFEVTPRGETVWEFWSPHIDDEGRRGTIVRMKRYETEFIRSILAATRPEPVRGGPTALRVPPPQGPPGHSPPAGTLWAAPVPCPHEPGPTRSPGSPRYR